MQLKHYVRHHHAGFPLQVDNLGLAVHRCKVSVRARGLRGLQPFLVRTSVDYSSAFGISTNMHLSFSSLVLLGLSLGLASSSDFSEMMMENGNCPTFWFPFKDRCYKYMASPMSWIDAEITCLSQGTNLVSIHSQEEQEFVKSLIGNFDPTRRRTWIGLRDKDKDHFFMWTDGCPLQFDHWQDGEPTTMEDMNIVLMSLV
ncbi:hypothetical protein WMY93_005411 [Mugilogobius chulae]|uniref:C-type lectin domain-containing protein n=1 Tax=Mugilogobius chulae TaxID=88201 RepID=A0AAW0PJQ3_9GOBI